MLHELYVDNFRSLVNVTFTPHETNLLIGSNNSGKSTLLDSLIFLATSVTEPLDKCADVIGAYAPHLLNRFLNRDTITFRLRATVPVGQTPREFSYSLSVAVRVTGPSTSIYVVDERLTVIRDGGHEVVIIENKGGHGVVADDAEPTVYKSVRFPPTSTVLGSTLEQTNVETTAFRSYLAAWQIFELSVEAIRRGVAGHPGATLRRNGENLGTALSSLKSSNERAYRSLLAAVRKIEPKIEFINFFTAPDRTAYMFFEDRDGRQILLDSISNGTLLYLALFYAIEASPRTLARPLVLIEEPENGLHVKFLREVVEAAHGPSARGQFIFTTHSPYFIDLFEEKLDRIFVMRGGPTHSELLQPNVQRVRQFLHDIPLGEQHFREMLT